MKMHSLQKAKSGDDPEMPGDEGVRVHLDHHHLEQMKSGPLPHGHEVEFHGKGHVVESGTRENGDGEPQHHMVIVLHKGGLEHEPAPNNEQGGLRNEIKQNKTASEAKAKQREEDRVAKRGAAEAYGKE